ncbi:autotransporter-associated beta strand repeat-containing protein [Luteolibacter marinus]|uniref:autotransporter-associated beta strand repeat-containing protein n=1 Tax=Luteolibacter marinus TaxID=2776705 RepID=UPI0018669DBA|nr:autotransporter-associated beta strand repeat-containing protein [Luteolibacter marinus]
MRKESNLKNLSKSLALPSLLLLAASPGVVAQEISTSTWVGFTDLDWNEGSNWDPEGVPSTGSNAEIIYGDIVDLSAPAAGDLGQLVVHDYSTLNISSTVGIIGTPFVDNPDPTPDVQAMGGLYVGSTGATGEINVNAGGALSVTSGNFRLGNGGGALGGTGTLNVNSGGSLGVSGVAMRIGHNGPGSLTLAGTGVVATNSEVDIGIEGGGIGSILQTGGTLTHTGGDFRVGAFGGTGNYEISAGTANLVNLRLNFAGVGTGTVTQSGTADVNHSGDFAIGWANSGDATYNMQGGTLDATNRMRFGIGNAVRTNLFNQTGGAVTVLERIDIGENAGPTNIYDISGGTVTLAGGDTRILVGAFNDSTGILNVSGTAVADFGAMVLGDGGTAAGTVNLNGGTVNVRQIFSGGSTAPVQMLNLNGSKIVAKENQGNFISGATLAVDLQAGGVTIDSNGFNVGVASSIAGPGTLTKTGAGFLNLNGDNSYEGGTTIAGGFVQVTLDEKLGSAAVPSNLTFDGGALQNQDSFLELAPNRTVVLADGSWGALRAGWGKSLTVAGKITGSGDLKAANDSGSVRLDNPANDYSGNTVIGDLVTGWPNSTTARLQLGADNVIPDTGLVVFDGGVNVDTLAVTATLDLNGYQETVSGLALLSGNAVIANASAFDSTLAVGAGDVSSSFAGVIQDNVALTKIGAGTLTLTGFNTYSGKTTVSGGLLAVSGDSISDANALDVSGGKVQPTGTETVDRLYFDGVQQDSGTYGGTGSGADHIVPERFEGSAGVVNVLSDPVVGGYATWAADKGLTLANDAPEFDAEPDGIENMLEYILGGDPLAADPGILPVSSLTATDYVFTFSRSDESEADTTVVFQYGSDLAGWTDVPVGETSAGPVAVAENGGLPDTITVTIARSESIDGKLFGRLQATQP